MAQMKFLRVLALIALLGLVVAACAPAEEDVVEEPVETPEEPVDEPEEPVDVPDVDGFVLGYLLPETGALAFLGPAQITAVELAVSEANDAGGVLGDDVTLVTGDEAGDAAVASTSVDRLLAEGVHAVIGAAASGMSLAVIDKIVGAGVLQCSASNTSPTFTTYNDNGLYFRTAPSDALQGPVLAETILGDGFSQVAIMARADDYGRGLATATKDALEEAGAEVVAEVVYDPEAATFDAEVGQVSGASPDAVALIAFDEGIQILQTLVEQGLGPADVGLYGADGIRSTSLNEDVDPGDPNVLDGMKGTAPDPGADPTYLDRLSDFAPDLEETIFSAQAFDCTTLVLLAAEAAGSSDGQAVAAEMRGLFEGDNSCAGFAECVEFIRAGETISYQAASGMTAFTDAGEPTGGTYEIWGFEDGELVTLDTQSITLD